MSKLTTFLAAISPPQIDRDILAQADRALNEVAPQVSGASREDLDQALILLVATLDRHCLKMNEPIQNYGPYALEFARQILHEVYGRQGHHVACDMARTNKEGGLYAVLKTVAYRRAESFIQNRLRVRIAAFWQGLAAAEQDVVFAEYVREYGHLWPPEMVAGKAMRLRIDFPRALELHVQTLRDLEKNTRP